MSSITIYINPFCKLCTDNIKNEHGCTVHNGGICPFADIGCTYVCGSSGKCMNGHTKLCDPKLLD